jgi:S1-C subfamily serine protease
MKSIIYLILICLPFIGVSQEINKDSLKLKQDELRERVAQNGSVTIIDTSGEVPVKKVIIKGERKNEMIMFKAEKDEIHPADARNIPVKLQKWTMGIALIESDMGLIVDEVKQGRAGEKAGVKAGDILLSMDGQEISTRAEFFSIWDNFQDGDSIPYIFKQGNSERSVTLPKE